MASSSRRKITRVIDKLFSEPYRFTFFQAIRLLQNIARPKNISDKDFGPVGYDVSPEKEAVHFSASSRLSYPGTQISAIKEHTASKGVGNLPPNIVVSFMGLTGPKGILPTHYTELQQQRQRDKDGALRDFFDVLNHRTISLFYRAWQKHQLPILYELHHKYPSLGTTDAITKALHSLVGNADENVRKQLPIDAENILFYAGQFCGLRRSGASLELILKTCFQVPVSVRQFEGEWVENAEDDRVQLAYSRNRKGRNNQLGVNVILGKQVYIVEGKFQLVLGPLSKQQFETIKPGTERLKALCRFTQSFVGVEVSFNLRMKVSSDAISGFSLGTGPESVPKLGWSTWLLAQDKDQKKSRTIEEIILPATGLM